MKRKIFRLTCSYTLGDSEHTIALKTLLMRLDIPDKETFWDTTPDYEELVSYNVINGYRVIYGIESVIVSDSYSLKPSLESASDDDLKIVLEYIWRIHQTMIEDMDDYEYINTYYNYGNDYTKQIKRRK